MYCLLCLELIHIKKHFILAKISKMTANQTKVWLLYIDLRPGQTCHSKDSGSAYSIDVGELGWQYGTGLKSHGTVTNLCTGREWPVNCMTVISARWRSNMPFQRRRKCIFRWPLMGRDWVDVELLYNSVKTGSQLVWRSDQLEKGAVEKTSTQRGWAQGPWSSSPGERERNAVRDNRVGVNRLQFCSVSNSLSHSAISNKVRGIFF